MKNSRKSDGQRSPTSSGNLPVIFQSILENLDAPIFSVDLNYAYTSFNQAHAAVMNARYGSEIKIGQNILETMLAETDRVEAKRCLDRALAGEQFIAPSFWGRKDQTWAFFEAAHHPIRSYEGGVIGAAVIAKKAAERKLAEKEIASRKKMEAALLDQLDAAVVASDDQDRLTVWNRAAEKLYGWNAQEALGKVSAEFTQTEYLEKAGAERLACLAAHDEWRGEATQTNRDGTRFPVDVSSIVLRDESGSVSGYLSINRNISARKQAEASQRESEEKFRTVADFTYDWEYWIDGNQRVLYNSPSCERITGRACQDFIANPDLLTEIVHPEDRAGFLEHMQVYQESTEAASLDFRILTPDGQERWIGHNCQPVFSPDGHRLGRRISNRDMSEQKSAEKALQASENLIRNVMDLVPNWIFVKDRQSRHILVNRACAAANGKSPEQMIGLCDLDFVQDANQAAAFMQDDREVIDSGKPKFIEEEQFTDAFGLKRSLQTVKIPFTDPGSGEPVLLGVVVDISERKQAEETIRRYAERMTAVNRLDHVISSSLDIGTVYDAFVSEMKDLVEFDRTSIVLLDEPGEKWQIIRQWSDGKAAFEPLVWVPVKGTAAEWVIQNQRALLESAIGEQGKWSEADALREELLQSRAILPLIIQGKVIGMLSLASRKPNTYQSGDLEVLQTLADQLAIAVQNANLYEQARLTTAELERRVQVRTSQLEKANKDLESFSYSVSHDLRAPLRAINGFAQILTRRYQDHLDEEGQHYLENVVEASNRMGVLIDDLLQYSRVGRASVRRQPVALDDLFAHVVSDLSPRIAETQALVELPPPGSTPRILSDPTILGQIFTNIIGNALTYHRADAAPLIRVTYQAETGHHLFGVEDYGIGIAAEYLEKIFNVFHRLHSAEEYSGTGIGLAIVKRSVELLGGQVWAVSSEGQGSTFWVQIPKE